MIPGERWHDGINFFWSEKLINEFISNHIKWKIVKLNAANTKMNNNLNLFDWNGNIRNIFDK